MRSKLTIFALFLTSSILIGQNNQIRLADRYFDQYGYIKASELYKEALVENDTNRYVLARLGDCFYKNSDVDYAVDWYRKWYKQASGSLDKEDTKDLLKYALSLHSKGIYNTALDVLKKYNALTGSDMELDPEAIKEHIEHIKTKTIEDVELKNLEFNSQYSDFGSFIHNNRMYFASSRISKDSLSQKYGWNEQAFLDLYEVVLGEDGDGKIYSIPKIISNDQIKTDAHEASVAITKDGKTMYFTRDDLNNNNQLQYDENGTSNLKLCRATFDGEKWVVTEADKKAFEGINVPNFSTGGPTLSPDEDRLYFVSDAPHEDAMGQTDLYYVKIIKDGEGYSYTTPKNLGPKINTEGRELFPHVSEGNILYFSSDGMYDKKLGLGLLDIYKVSLNDEESLVENMQAPYNSTKDDFAIFIMEQQDNSTEEKFGYFSSNRDNHPDAQGDDDIYSFSVYKCSQSVKGVVRESVNLQPLDSALVELFDSEGMKLKSKLVDSTGVYSFDVDCGMTYTLKGTKEGFEPDTKIFTTTLENKKVNEIDLLLTPLPCVIKTDPIFFPFDEYYITEKAERALRPVLDTLLVNRQIRIKIESHTDTRGSNEYNEVLSDNRAKSTRDYLIKEGVHASQIESAIGYGEYRLCYTDAEINALPTRDEREAVHQKNRRSRFVIVDCDDGTRDCEE